MSARGRVLYVDDEPDNLVVFRAGFADDFVVLEATGGREALEILERQPVDCLLVDQRMPEMSGIELLEVVKDRWPDVVRIVLTGYTYADDIIAAINKGQVYKFVTKPWERKDLLLTIQRALEARELDLRNRRLTQELLRQEKFAVLGRFAAAISHEIKNSLCGTTFAELVRKRYPEDKDVAAWTRQLESASERIRALVQEVGDFACGRRDWTQRAQPVRPVVEGVLRFLQYDEAFGRIETRVVVAAEPWALMNRLKLEQVLLNVLKNAAEAVEGAPVKKVTVTLAATEGRAEIAVEDTGPGIPAEIRDRVFEPFFTTKGARGTGLGLEIAKAIVEEHGGTIGFESAPGRTVFRIRLPQAKEDRAPPAADAARQSGNR